MSLFGILAASISTPAPIMLSGSLEATATAGTSTSATRTITVPVGNSGDIEIGFTDVGTVLLAQYSKNGGAFTNFSTGAVINFANGDTIALRATGNDAGESRTFTLRDVTRNNLLIQTAVHTGA